MDAPHSGIKIQLIRFVLGLAGFAVAAGAAPIDATLTTAEKRQLKQEARLVVDLLQNYHYSGGSFREIENKEMVARFLAELDPDSYLLSPDDVAFLHQRFDRTLKSVYLLRGDLQPAFEIFDLFADRARERSAWIKQRLPRGFDFTVAEEFEEAHEASAAAAAIPADRQWELWLKEQVLREILAGRDPAAAAAAVGERYREMDRQLAAADSLSVRERFFDALIRSFDPHSGYFSADSAREFAAGMENAVAGIGLELAKEKGHCVVTAVQPGSPADINADLQPGDIVDEIAAEGSPPVDASRRPLRELVALVCGEPGTKLCLTYHPPGGTARQTVTLERTRVLLGASRAHGAVSVVPGPEPAGRRIGWIVLPAFYAAGEGPDATSATRDVRDLIEQMMTRGIDGLVLDLRDNPGGAMTETTALSGLFLPAGTVVISRGMDGVQMEHKIDARAPLYNGPLSILTSPQSASASEVFSGAMKFYHRAVIIGAPATFGKGTVQSYIELAKARPESPATETANWGTLRLTSQRFYLPDGRTVQRNGVAADIVLPVKYERPEPREAELPHALPAEVIVPPAGASPAQPAPGQSAVSAPLLARLQETAGKDLKELPEWELWRQIQVARQTAETREKFNLQLEPRRNEWRQQRAAWAALVRTRRQLTVQAAYRTDPLALTLLAPTSAAHQAKLRVARGEDGQPLLWKLHRGSFIVETDGGRLRALRLPAINFPDFAGDTAGLAAAFAAGAGFAVEPEAIGLALQDAALLEERTDDAIRACFVRRIGPGHPEASTTRGLDALLRRMAEIDGEMLRERPGLDVPLRECLRLTAAWAAGPPGAP